MKALYSFLVAITLPSVALAQTNSTPASQQPRLHIAVLPFGNATGDPAWDDWERALPSQIRSCLGEAI